MKKIILFLCAFFCGAFVFAKNVNVEIGGKNYKLNLAETGAAESFVSSALGKNLDMVKYGGFEFYSYTALNAAASDEQTSFYKAGHVYYNLDFNAISVAYADHNLGSYKAVEIGEFADKSVCAALKNLSERNVFVFNAE